jgi:hypothetical protein
MRPKSSTKYQAFADLTPRDTKAVHAIRLVADEDTLALILALTGLALMTVAAASMLVALSIF